MEVTGRGGGQRAVRTWDVGVIPPTPPVLDELTPPAGEVALGRGERGAFRCRARVPAARPADRLAFEWVLTALADLSGWWIDHGRSFSSRPS